MFYIPLGPIDGSWGSWADWSQCSQSCGGGTETRRRLCDSPAPAQGGTDCQGDQHQERQCNTETCHGKGKNFGYRAISQLKMAKVFGFYCEYCKNRYLQFAVNRK